MIARPRRVRHRPPYHPSPGCRRLFPRFCGTKHHRAFVFFTYRGKTFDIQVCYGVNILRLTIWISKQILLTSLHIFIEVLYLGEFDYKSRQFHFGDHFLNSHYLFLVSVLVIWGEIRFWSLSYCSWKDGLLFSCSSTLKVPMRFQKLFQGLLFHFQ